MRKHRLTEISTIMISHNMGKDKVKLKKNNTLERENMANNHMGIVI